MRTAPPVALLVLLAAGGCSESIPPPGPAVPAAAPAEIAGLTEAGQLAHRVLNDSATFSSGMAGLGGQPSVEALAFRVLLREPPAAARAAFADLRVPGSHARWLYGLCGA